MIDDPDALANARAIADDIIARDAARDAARDERRSWVTTVGVAMVALSLSAALLSVIFPNDDPGSTSVSPDQDTDLTELYVDVENLPDVYTGQLVDVDADGRPDVALFGSTNVPVVRPLVESEGIDWTPLVVAFLTGLGLIAAGIISPVAGAWAKNRWPSTEREGKTDEYRT